jgi:uncharacterized protein HemY
MNRRSWSPFALPLAALLSLGPVAPSASHAAAMPPEVLEALLAAEFARVGGDAQAAAAHALVAAQASPDVVLAERAVESALEAGDTFRAAAALERWTQLQPQSTRRDALALRFHIVQGDDDRAESLRPRHRA